MYDGNVKNIEDITIGEYIMGDDSTKRTVLELCSGRDEMFKIIFNKGGNYYTVNKLHKLVLKRIKTVLNPDRRSAIKDLNLTNSTEQNSMLLEMTVEDYMKQNKQFKKIHTIYKSECVIFDIITPITEDPYTIGKNINTTIPLEYKTNTKDNRLKLLSGLLDRHGCYEDNNLGYEYIQENENLFNDVVFISRSLGLLCITKIIKKVINNTEKMFFKCFITGEILNELSCKILKKDIFYPRIQKKVSQNSSYFKIEPKGEDQYFGFILDGNHRFLLGSFDVVRNTGKTTLITSILYEKKHIFPVGMVISGTEDSNGFYRKIFPSSFVYNRYDEDKITSFIRRQKIAKTHLENPWGVILLDDCTDDPSLFRKPLQASMYKNGRHWKMLYILSLQYCMDVRPAIRTNIDGTFILREPNLKNRRALYENYAGIIPDFFLFCELLDFLTNDYTALYIHNSSTSNNWQDCIFYYKASKVPENFKFGSPEFWEFHNSRYNINYIDPVI